MSGMSNSMSNPVVWGLMGVIMFLATNLLSFWFGKKDSVSEKSCKERMCASDKLQGSLYSLMEKKLDYIIKRMDENFDQERG